MNSVSNVSKYTEYVQFSLWTSDIKTKPAEKPTRNKQYDPECIRGIWINSGSKGKLPVGVKRCTFDEYLDLIVTGHSVKRIGKIMDKEQPSRFLFIDLDNDLGENVTEVELESLQLISNNRILFYPSTSGTPYKWHLYILTANLMKDTDDLKSETLNIISDLEKVCKRKVTCDSKCYKNWYQVCYGMPQEDHYKLDVPDDTEFFCHQILKDGDLEQTKHFSSVDEFFIRTGRVKKSEDGQSPRIVPYNTKLLARAVGKSELRDKPFSIYPPYIFRGASSSWKIPEGLRYKTAQKWILTLVPQWYKCNLKYGLNYTVDDLIYTLKRLCKTNFDSFETFNWENIQKGLLVKVFELKGKTWEEIEALSEARIRTYRTEQRTWDIIMRLKAEFAYDDCTLTFSDKKSLRDALYKYNISIKTVKKHLQRAGFDITILKDGRSDRGSSKFDFDKYPENENGQRLVPREELTPSLRNKASKLKIKLKAV